MARACVVAGVLDDGEKDCLERGKQLRKGNSLSLAFKVEGKRHCCDWSSTAYPARSIPINACRTEHGLSLLT
jgi:hypothetical protein